MRSIVNQHTFLRRLHFLNRANNRIRSTSSVQTWQRQPAAPSFWTLFKHPSHLIFLSTNIGLLIHLRCYSMFRQKIAEDAETDVNDNQESQALPQEKVRKNEAQPSQDPYYSSYDDKIVNEKRKARTIKKLPTLIERVRESKQTTDNFLQHRQKIVSIFNDTPDNIDALFQDHHDYHPGTNSNRDDPEMMPITNYSQIPQALRLQDLIYSDVNIKSAILLLSTSLINSVLVELNLKNLLLQQGEESMIIKDSIINEIKDPSIQQTALKLLSTIYDKERHGTPSSFKNFFANLDKEEVSKFVDSLKHSDAFTSIESFRTNFVYFKSSQFLNYNGNNDNSKFLESRTNMVKFYSNEVNNAEYIEKFNHEFDQYKGDNNHLNLALGISSHLINCSSSIPSYGIFKFLMDKFENLKLHNFEGLVYKSLFQFKHQSLILSNGVSAPPLDAKHFQHLIESSPSILPSLIKYQITRDDSSNFKQLLSFLNFKEVSHYEKLLNQTKFQTLLSKSMYYKTNLNFKELNNTIEFSKPLYLLPQDIYDIMNSCIQFKQFQYLDSLFNKLVIHSMNDKSNKISLNIGESNKQLLLLNSNFSIEEIQAKIFNDQLFEILIRSSRLSHDLGRLMWILPHLDEFLNDVSKQKTILFNTELIKEVYLSLKQFGLEGKIYSYRNLLNFKQFE